MTAVRVVLERASSSIELTEAVSFSFVKERYTPYTVFSGVFKGECTPSEIRAIRLYLGSKSVHYGFADKLVCEKRNGVSLIRLRSCGFSLLLGQNQSEPGIISSPNLGTIIGRNIPIYTLAYESNTATVNYVYINPRTTIWEAICVYAMKAYSTHPFIYGANTVRCHPMGDVTHDLNDKKVVTVRRQEGLTNLISHAYTNDLEDEWSISRSNDFAIARHITKQKYYERENEWLYDLNDQLRYRMNYADRARVSRGFTYYGYSGEDLLDKVNISRAELIALGAEIDRLEVQGSSKGIFTTLDFYTDSYCPSQV